jgi:HAD superfamily hydrolase (TIGR01509 family)
VTGGQRRLHGFLADQGMPAEERDPLVPRLHARKSEIFFSLALQGKVPARAGAVRLLDELAAARVTVAVATTGSRSWVEPLLDRHFGLARFAHVVTGEDVAQTKPHPEAYEIALRRLGIDAGEAVAIEDSDNGVRSARGAGVPVLAVTNDYTAGQALAGAAVIADGFGMPDAPAAVRHDPAGVMPGGVVDVATLRRVVEVTYRQG